MNTIQRSINISSLGHAALSLLFFAMAALQLNDPDPLLWTTTYLFIAGIPLARVLSYHLVIPFSVAVGLAFACLLISLPGFVDYLGSGDYALIGAEMTSERPYIYRISP